MRIYEIAIDGTPTGVHRTIGLEDGIPPGWTRLAPPKGAHVVFVGAGWDVYDEPPRPPVPEEVTMRQAKLQLSRAGLLATANAAIEALEGQRGEEARIEWRDARTLRRDHPLVAGIGSALGLDDAAKDDLFRAAALIP